MEIIETKDFIRAFKNLPKEIQELCIVQKERFRESRRDPRLHLKKVASLRFVFSFRVTHHYRVFFYFKNSETAVFFEIDHRKDIYK